MMQYMGLGAAQAEQELTVCETFPGFDLSTANPATPCIKDKQQSEKATYRLGESL